jgi:hypothetical protein
MLTAMLWGHRITLRKTKTKTTKRKSKRKTTKRKTRRKTPKRKSNLTSPPTPSLMKWAVSILEMILWAMKILQ